MQHQTHVNRDICVNHQMYLIRWKNVIRDVCLTTGRFARRCFTELQGSSLRDSRSSGTFGDSPLRDSGTFGNSSRSDSGAVNCDSRSLV